MSAATHYSCTAVHPKRVGRQWPGSHSPGCPVAPGHSPGTAALKGCKECRDERQKGLHGIELAEYRRQFIDQFGACAICGKTQTSALAVDHNHKTGSIRGLLCHQCNLGIGNFKDDPELLHRAILYLMKG